MNLYTRSLVALSFLFLAACQQAVRPNHDDSSAVPAPTVGQETPPPAPEVLPPPVVVEPSLPAPVVIAEPVPDPTYGLGEEVFARLRAGLEPGACDAGGDIARRWRQRFAANPTGFSHLLESVLPLMDYVSRQVEQEQLPAEFALIPLIESGYKPSAIGQGGPAGLWQMIPSTARNHGIVIHAGYDGRLSPIESTHAALSYLNTLHAMMGPWPATVMAYNAGENRVRAAIARSPGADLTAGKHHPHGLNDVTYEYVGKLQALSCLIVDSERAGIPLPLQTRFERMQELPVDADVTSLDQFAKRRGIDAKSLRELNPAYKGGRVVTGAPRRVLVPASAINTTTTPSSTLP